MCSIDGKTLGWLSMLPLVRHHYDLTATKFLDTLALRYHMALFEMKGSCDGCGDPFTISHALDCQKGGLVIKHHNRIRDALGDITALAHSEVLREPTVRETNDKNDKYCLSSRFENLWDVAASDNGTDWHMSDKF